MDARLRAVSEDRKDDLWKGDSSGSARKFDPNDPCTYSTIKKYKCFLDNGEQKCERTEQLLRRCPGSIFCVDHDLFCSICKRGRVDQNSHFGPVEVVESETEYTQGNAASGSTPFGGKENDGALSFPRPPRGFEQQPWNSTVPAPSMEPDWPRWFGQRDTERHDSPSARVPGAFTGFGGIMDAIEDVVRETEDMAQSFLHVFGLDGDETKNSGNPFDRWFGGDMFGGTERRSPTPPEANSSQSTPKPVFDPKDFREV